MKVGDKFIMWEDKFENADVREGDICKILDFDDEGVKYLVERTNDFWYVTPKILEKKMKNRTTCPLADGGTVTLTGETITFSEAGGKKNDAGKNRLELIPVEAIEQIGLAYTFGAKKYEDNNWRKGFKWTRLVGALLRHVTAWAAGEDKDPESGLSHLAHAGACLTMLLAHEQLGYGEDDRVKTKTND